MQRRQDVSTDKAKWNPSVPQSGAAARVSARSGPSNRRTRDSTGGGTGGWCRGSKAALPLGDGEIRDQIGGWATDSAVCAPDEPRSWRSCCHWWNCELCLFFCEFDDFPEFNNSSASFLMCLTCLCLQEVHTWQLIEARSGGLSAPLQLV